MLDNLWVFEIGSGNGFHQDLTLFGAVYGKGTVIGVVPEVFLTRIQTL
jgi:hypothetical protein